MNKFNYAISYPDKEDIFRNEEAISGEEVLKIFESHPWKEEMTKEVTHHPPSLEIVRHSDKAKLGFTVSVDFPSDFFGLFAVPLARSVSNVAGAIDYKSADKYSGYLNFQDGKDMLHFFLQGETEKVKDVFNRESDKAFKRVLDTKPGGVLIARIGGPLLTFLSGYILYILVKESYFGWGFFLALVFFLIFLFGSIRFESDVREARKNK